MKISRLRIVAFTVFCLADLSACSYIKSYFPDKEKDYHYSKEIPPLQFPPDLQPERSTQRLQAEFEQQQTTVVEQDRSAATAENVPQMSIDATASELAVAVEEQPDAGSTETEPVELISDTEIEISDQVRTDPYQMDQSVELYEQMTHPDAGGFDSFESGIYPPGMEVETVEQQETVAKPAQQSAIAGQQTDQSPVSAEEIAAPAAAKVRFMVFADSGKRIQIDEPLDKSWRMVSKAISHNSIEVTGRHRALNQFDVQYDPNEQVYQDGSLWDEVVFFFGEDQKQEKAFHIKLLEGDGITEVLVSDENDVPLSEGEGLKLLQLLFRTIQANLAQQ